MTLVFKNLVKAVRANPDTHPLFHSGRGLSVYQSNLPPQTGTSRNDSERVMCGSLHWQWPHGGVPGHHKTECYYGNRFTSKNKLVQTIKHCIRYYNTRRVLHIQGVLTPLEKHAIYLAA